MVSSFSPGNPATGKSPSIIFGLTVIPSKEIVAGL
jgi:hypothetical protein